MARSQRSAQLLPCLVLGLGACLLLHSALQLSFVSPRQQQARQTSVALRAEEGETKTDYKLPAPDLNILNRNAKIGQTYDQDKKGNMWTVEQQPVRKAEEEPLPAGIYIPFIIVLTIGSIIFFATLTGNDSSFGGVIGDGSLQVGD
mmetsp:Transcript_17976/g.40682  ORF Transcript_17976/g.40682 Transcript_17976/m.40682 type:complete len:146 (-) Transcript_17976:193-630(-)